jgi:hypothetical protein
MAILVAVILGRCSPVSGNKILRGLAGRGASSWRATCATRIATTHDRATSCGLSWPRYARLLILCPKTRAQRRGVTMKPFTCTAVILCALGLVSCAGEIGRVSGHPPSNYAFLDMYDRPIPARRLARNSAPQVVQPAQSEAGSGQATVGGAAPSSPREYSPEWWAQERAREERDAARIKAISQICRC